MSLLILVRCAVFFGALLFLVTENVTPVDVTVLFFSWAQVPLSILMAVCILVGVVFSALIGLLEGARLRQQNRRLHRLVGRLEEQIRLSKRVEAAGVAEKPTAPSPPLDYPRP